MEQIALTMYTGNYSTNIVCIVADHYRIKLDRKRSIWSIYSYDCFNDDQPVSEYDTLENAIQDLVVLERVKSYEKLIEDLKEAEKKFNIDDQDCCSRCGRTL